MFNVEFSVREIRAKEREEGHKEGKLENAIEVAKRFLKMGLSPRDVAKGTGLSESVVLKIEQDDSFSATDILNNK